MQSWRESLLESLLNVASGFVVAYLVWWFIVTPYLGLTMSPSQGATVIAIFQVASLIRMFLWRRFFNWWDERNKR